MTRSSPAPVTRQGFTTPLLCSSLYLRKRVQLKSSNSVCKTRPLTPSLSPGERVAKGRVRGNGNSNCDGSVWIIACSDPRYTKRPR